MNRIHFEVGETAVTIVSDDAFHKVAKDAIFEAREAIRRKISEDPFFGTTYSPYPVSKGDHELIRHMCQASESADVGPMASVAGAVAYHAVKRMSEEGAGFAIVENGGDIALHIDRDVTIGIFAGDSPLKDVALHVPAREGIFGICSSSGKIGPSVSFGRSDICTVFSDDVLLADACATALGNMIGGGDLETPMDRICSVEGVEGCLVSADGKVAMQGKVPELVRAKVDSDRISRIMF